MWWFYATVMVLATIWNLFMPISMAVTPDCDFRQELVMGQEYYIYNVEYPNNYAGAVGCRWTAIGTTNTKVVLSCEDVNLPASTDCSVDTLVVSLSGDQNFADGHNYCGKGSFSVVSNANQLSIGLFTKSYTTGGRFLCSVTSIQDNNESILPPTNVCDCGWKQGTRIVGGHETGINEYPFMAGIINLDNADLICGSSVISYRYVLTAAHCVFNKQPSDIGVLVGDHNISTGAETAASALYLVRAYEIHPNFDSKLYLNDIAIVQTTLQITFSLYVGPVCLPFRYTTVNFDGQTLTALGWGQLEFTGPKSDTLQEVDLTVISNSECDAAYDEVNVTAQQLCTYADGKDTCQSDSGGPLLWIDPATRRVQLIAITTFGLGCASAKPSINTRIAPYLTWIVQRTSDAGYCIK